MKYLFLLLALPFCLHPLFAQKEDYTWVMGYPNDPPDLYYPYIGGTMINFKNGRPDTTRFFTLAGMSQSASISDKDGNLLFYSNGCEVFNNIHQIMPNGNKLNDGDGYHYGCVAPILGYTDAQGIVALPWPKHPGIYKVFHIRFDEPGLPSATLLETTVDMRMDNGLGDVTEKNQSIHEESYLNRIAAVRHGNGTDWWLALPKNRSREILVFLFDSSGVHPPVRQDVSVVPNKGGWGQMNFSPDGSRLVDIMFDQGQLFDFDRCSGRLFNARLIQFDTLDNISAGATFSPNSRYLYVCREDSLYQYDLGASDFNSTRLTVGAYDHFYDTLRSSSTFFYQMLPAPDGKIYMTVPDGSCYMHIIHRPDERGTACDFENHGLLMPTFHAFAVPNLPNFRLGAADPPCGTHGGCLYQDGSAQTDRVKLFPNPATWYVDVAVPPGTDLPLDFQVYDALGRLLLEETIDCSLHRVELGDWPEAGYFYRLSDANGRRVAAGTLVKVDGR
ncbi:MAG: T9SS type A sorting domain-containing protein [Saprospiraceae bacterium]